MSQAPPNLPPLDEAFDIIVKQAHARVFFEKLAGRGYIPQNDQEAESLLSLGMQAASVPQAQAQQKQAHDRFAPVNQAVSAVLAGQGVDTGYSSVQAYNEDQVYQKAALDLASDPAIYNATLALKIAEAQHAAS